MLTPIEIQSKNFKSGIGYQKGDVEDFLSILSDDYETIFKENRELKERCNFLTNALEHYKSIEKEMQDALDLAKKAAEQIKCDAKLQAKQIEEDAENKSKLVIAESQERIKYLQDEIYNLEKQYESYINKCKELIEEELKSLNSKTVKLTSENN